MAIKLHLGCGRKKLEGWVNCDISKDVMPDKVFDMCKIPYPNASVDEILSEHSLEHVSDFSKAVKEMHRVLKPGGRAKIIVPCACVYGSYLPQHNYYFSYASFLPFAKDFAEWYYDFHFSSVRVRFRFLYFNRIISPIANKFWFFYEHTLLSHIFPAAEIEVVLVK